MRRIRTIVLVLGIAVLAGGAGLAGGVAGAQNPRVQERLSQTRLGRAILARLGRRATLNAELNLTDAQRQAIAQTLKEHKQEIARAAEPVVADRRALRALVLADTPDEAAIRKAAGDLSGAIGDAAVVLSRVKTDIVTKAQLTPEQRKKIAKFRAANDDAADEFLSELEKSQ
jgi:Spy/CpxP family protein refolding chaperone